MKKPQIVKHGELILNCGKYRVNIILDDKTLQYFHVPIAYQIQQIVYKTMGLSILVSIFEGAKAQKIGLKVLKILKYDFGKSLSKEM